MLVLRTLKRIKKLENLYFYNYVTVRFQSREAAAHSSQGEAVRRRYSKPLSNVDRKPLTQNFVSNLFSGSLDREIFTFPEVLRESEIDIVINHSLEVEDFLRDTKNEEITEETLVKLRELELFGLSVPQEYGGAGYNESECKFLQECTGTNLKIARFLGYNENLGCKLLSLFGSKEQKEKYLPSLAQGKSLMTLAYLEAAPMVDFSGIEAYAMYDEVKDQYILNGEKKWVHNADKADLFFVVTKLAKYILSETGAMVQLHAFIVERNTPGFSVQKLKSEITQENGLYEVTLKDVVIPRGNAVDLDGNTFMKAALCHNNVTDAALSCNIMKSITHEIMRFMHGKNIDPSKRDWGFLQDNLVYLLTYVYALESVIYLVTGRYDKYENPDLLYESVLVKSFAIESLKVGIQKYTEILGRESFKSQGRLEEAMKALQYYSVFDENIEYLKMMTAAEGAAYAGRTLHQAVKILRTPFEHNFEAFKYKFSVKRVGSDLKPVKSHNFRKEVHECLQGAANQMEVNFEIFQKALLDLFVENGVDILKKEYALVQLANLATYIYASVACLSRAHSSIVYDFPDCNNELNFAEIFARISDTKVNEIYSEQLKYKNLVALYDRLGKETFSRKGYPVEHPLSRTF